MRWIHYWLALGCLIVAVACTFVTPINWIQASYNVLVAILNMLFALFWRLEGD